MTLATLIKKDGLRELVTMTPATLATLEGKNGPTVATVAVADPTELEINIGLSTEEEVKIRKLFTALKEKDQDIIDSLLEDCRTIPGRREYFLEWADDPVPIFIPTGGKCN